MHTYMYMYIYTYVDVYICTYVYFYIYLSIYSSIHLGHSVCSHLDASFVFSDSQVSLVAIQRGRSVCHVQGKIYANTIKISWPSRATRSRSLQALHHCYLVELAGRLLLAAGLGGGLLARVVVKLKHKQKAIQRQDRGGGNQSEHCLAKDRVLFAPYLFPHHFLLLLECTNHWHETSRQQQSEQQETPRKWGWLGMAG